MGVILNEDLAAGRRLQVRTVLFSEGTYQVEVEEFWPFLQLSDQGELLDAFCTCKRAESKGSCPHLAAAYLKIMSGQTEPLHARFRDSFWNQIGWIAFERIGSDPSRMKLSSQGTYEAYAITGRRLFSLRPLTEKARRGLKKLLFERPLETEETSLKFSKLSHEEIALWKQGRPSQQLRYELSFWSDLAKQWMNRQEAGQSYQLSFEPLDDLPHTVRIRFSDLEIESYIAAVDWPRLIPALALIQSPLTTYAVRIEGVRAIQYSKEKKSFHLEFAELAMKMPPISEEGIAVDHWRYLPERGFYPSAPDPFLEMEEIPFEKVDAFLTTHQKLIAKVLVGETLHLGTIIPRYRLTINSEKALIIRCYVFEEGDLHQEGAECFGRWVYLPQRGFYCLEEGLFVGKEQIIPKEQVGAFVSRHRVWLQAHEGFETHVSTIESRLGYRVNNGLEFYTRLEFHPFQQNQFLNLLFQLGNEV